MDPVGSTSEDCGWYLSKEEDVPIGSHTSLAVDQLDCASAWEVNTAGSTSMIIGL
jgi:hypothetical protein